MSESDRRQVILDAALEVFSEHGFHKATIKQIAKAANLKSSALIYWYFDDKQALLLEIMNDLAPSFLQTAPEEQAALLDIPPEQLLPYAATAFLSFIDDPKSNQLFRLYISEAVRNEDVATFAASFQRVGLNFLSKYLDHQIEIGRFRPHDTTISARNFIGVVMMYVLSHEVFPALRENLPPRDVYFQTSIEHFLRGLSYEE